MFDSLPCYDRCCRTFPFNYGGETSHVPLKYGQHSEGGFYTFIDYSVEEAMIGGWKIHINLEPDFTKIREAWNKTILPILVQYNIKQFKIVQEGYISLTREHGDLQGRVVTIYLVHNPEFQINGQRGENDLYQMLAQIQRDLVRRGIGSGHFAPIDAIIDNSPYFSYRCDAGTQPGPVPGSFMLITTEQAQTLSEMQQPSTQLFNPVPHLDNYNLQNFNLNLAVQNNTHHP